ncbi:hypothetical protein FAI41_05460 [Acetobacteraceae bacterium]|nr:hypothetical protein FAI41_05460 [Acetobacteraceae bacterium]
MSKKKFNSGVYLSLFLFTGFTGIFSLGGSVKAASPSPKTFYKGEEIDLQAPCSIINIEVDPTLTKGINQKGILPKNMTLNVAKDEAQNRILIRANECVPGAGLSLQIPTNFSVIYHDSPKASLKISGAVASFEGNVTDGGEVSLGQVDSLDLKMTGISKVSVEKLHRAAQLIVADGASFTSMDSDLSVFSLFGSAHSDVLLHSGHIATAHFTMADESQAQVFASVGHADVRTKDKGFVRLGAVAQAPEITDGSIIRKETVPAGSIVISQPDVVVSPPPADILALDSTEMPSAFSKTVSDNAKGSAVQPALTGDAALSQGDAATQPAPGVAVTATQPIASTPVAPISAPVPTASASENVPVTDQKAIKEEIKKEKADLKAAKKDEKRMNELATASANTSSSLMVS